MYFPTIVMIHGGSIASMDENANKSAKGKLRSLKKRAAAAAAELSAADDNGGQSSSTESSGEVYERRQAHDARKGSANDEGTAAAAGIGTHPAAQRPKKKTKRSAPVAAPTHDSIAKHISQQMGSAALSQQASYHEGSGSRNPYRNQSLINSSTPEDFQGMNRFNVHAQALSSLLLGRSSEASLNPRPYLGGSNPLLTQSSLAATLASQNQSLLGQHSTGLLSSSSSSVPSLPYPTLQRQMLFPNSNESDTILNMLIAQRFPNHFQHQHQQQSWSGQPSLTSLSIQQLLLASPYHASLHNSANPFLLGGNNNNNTAQLSNEPNFSLRQQNELSDRLGPSVAMAQQRFAAEEPVTPSIRHYAAAISHLLGEDATNQRGLQSQALATTAATTRAEKDPPAAMAQVNRDNHAEAKDTDDDDDEDSNLDIGDDVPKDLPFIIGLSEDKLILNDHQVFLRQQIEVFRATKEDASTHTRGRTKQVRLGQIGIRCRHCAHMPITMRGRGSIYFPSQLMGIYQVAQNMAKLHFLGGGCSQVPAETIQQFQKARDTVNSGVGRVYWTQAAKKVGLVDSTDNCIRFVRDLQNEGKKGQHNMMMAERK